MGGDIEKNVAHHLEFARKAAEQSAQLLVFPELSLTGYELDIARAQAISTASPRLDALRNFAVEASMTIVAGAPVLHESGDLHIGAFIFKPDGAISTYSKQHVHESEQHVFTSGPGAPPFRVGDATVALAICADASHSQHAATAASHGASIYAVGVMITKEDYPRKAGLMQQYAKEHGMTVLMANYSGTTGGWKAAGRSAVWSEDGSMVAVAPDAEEALLVWTAKSTRRQHDTSAQSTKRGVLE